MRRSMYGDGDDRAFRQQMREENRMLKQELSEQRHVIQKLQTDIKALSVAVLQLTERATQLTRAHDLQMADAQLLLYTMADKYLPNNEDLLAKYRHQ